MSKELNYSEINDGGSRLVSLDLTRLFAMLMMMQGHTIYALASPETLNTSEIGWQIWTFLRGATAPTFLFVSGIVHLFANKRLDDGSLSSTTIKKRITIALILIAIGYILVFPAGRVYDLFFVDSDGWRLFFQVNVLQMFGVSLLLLLLHYLFTKNDKQLGILSLITGFLIMFLSPLVQSVDWFNYLPEFFAAYLSRETGSLFPLFPFTAYLFFGTAFGCFIKQLEPEMRYKFLLKYSWLIGVPILLIGYPFMKHWWSIGIFDSSNVNLGLFAVRLGVVFLLLSIMTFVYSLTKGLSKYYTLFGKRAIYIYVIHLIIIYGNLVVPGFNDYFKSSLNLTYSLLAAAIVIALSLLVVFIFDYTTKRHKIAPSFYKYIVTAYLIYLFFI